MSDQRDALAQKLIGHYAYYGVTFNFDALARYYQQVVRIWHKWLSRRSHKAYLDWERMKAILARWRLPPPRIYHSYTKRVANP